MKKVTEETKIKHQVKDYLRLKGWFVFHNLAGLGVYPGISDFIAIKNGYTVFVEIKTPKGCQSRNQMTFENDVRKQNGYYIVLKSLEDAERMNKFYEN